MLQASAAMSEALSELRRQCAEAGGELEGLILDVRWNRGGWDSVSLALAAHFFQTTTTVLTKRTRLAAVAVPLRAGDGSAEPVEQPPVKQDHTAFLPYQEALSVVPVEPPAQRYDGPLVLVRHQTFAQGNSDLTSSCSQLQCEHTHSAAEIFVLAMRQHPHCISVGRPTGGCLSDILCMMMPNGWRLG